ncbi:MAG: phosphoribosyltransferase family protein [Candidatus Sungbacteria bacterium]|nr:phosphoribosyltransferase family protein [bacterium]MDZ4285599.1 phosphoribosyltransferase family protein [Candidatus Sungbacteria bacterium]
MYEKEVVALFGRLGVIIPNSHVIYSSGKHGSIYINKDALYPHAMDTAMLCRLLTRYFVSFDIDCVVGPEKGGIILAQWAGYYLSEYLWREVTSVFAEKRRIPIKQIPLMRPTDVSPLFYEDSFVFTRGYDRFVAGKRVLVVEDVLTTGTTVRKVVELVRACGGRVEGVGALWNRGSVTSRDIGDVPRLFSLLDINIDAWESNECPLCRRNIPINTELGKGQELGIERGKGENG